MTISFDANILVGYYNARAGILGSTTTGSSGVRPKVAPTAPWTSTAAAAAKTSAAVKSALLGRDFIDENAAKLDLPSASADYKKLFALYQGLDTLMGVTQQAQTKNISSLDLARVQKTFAGGLAEIMDYVREAELEKFRLTAGDAATSARSAMGVPKAKTEYVTTPLISGSSGGVVPAFEGAVKFDIIIKRINATSTVSIDLADMGSQPRTLANVIIHINQELTDAGLATRVASQRIPAAPKTIQVGGKTVTLAAGADQWALKIKVDSGETVSFAAPATQPAIYVAQSVGDPDPDHKASTNDGVTQRQLLKFQVGASTDAPAPLQAAGEANWVDGRVFAETLGSEVKTVRATATAADGSVYMLADVTGKTGDQEIKGEQDVALLKYDAAGNLLYRRTLGAASEASGMALSVSADGQVAIAGSVTGTLGGAIDGPINSGATGSFATKTDSFVTLFDKDGQEVWTERRGARQDDEATQVAFGADGTVYVAGRAKSTMAGATAIGGWDGYIQAFKADVAGKIQTLFTQSFGTAGDDKPSGLVVDGTSLVVAGVEDGRGVLRRFDVSGAAPSLTSTRDLGDLQGGAIAGLALDGAEVVVAGTTRNASLSGGTITRAHAGGSDAFVARMSANLSGGGTLAYYGGTGDDKATSLAVSGGRVWIGGSAGTDLPGQAPVGTKDGFLAELDVAGGGIAWSRRFTGKDRQAAPTSIAVDMQGASVLDRLGLPKGTLGLADSQKITAASSLRAGDQFTVRVGEGGRFNTVTIDNADTLQTLATKVRRAVGFQAKVEIVTVEGTRRLQIKPLNDRTLVEIGHGKGDKDALAVLGLPEGLVRATTVGDDGKLVPADGKAMIYGLGLSSELNLDNADQVKHAMAEVAAAMGVVRSIYKDLVAAASPKTASSAAVSGPVPTYLTNQIANYQAALDRLTGGA